MLRYRHDRSRAVGMRDDISDWLHEIGLGEYAGTFSENAIDFGVLRDLSEDDLRALGVTKLGHRKKLLHEIAEYVARPPSPQNGDPQLKMLTVLFCDLEGSTALAELYEGDKEVLREITRAFRHCCEAAVKVNGGTVAGYRGDGLLVVFGFPSSMEGDAERAVRAAYRITNDVRDLTIVPGLKLDCRIGIATGEAVVGDVISSDLTKETDVVGIVPNLAARLQSLADPGTILICDATRKRVRGIADCTSLAAARFKGITEAQGVWRVDAVRQEGDRFAPTHPVDELTPLVGRDQELAKLMHHWDLAEKGKGQAVLLVGEAGIGKSRLIHALLAKLPTSRRESIHCFCLEHHRNSVLSPVVALVERLAGFERGDSAALRLDKLELLLNVAGSSSDAVSLYADLLSVPAADRYVPLGLTPELQKERTLALLEAQLRWMAASKPVLLTVEDVHWADATTGELVERILAWLPEVPLMLLMTGRPEELSAPWAHGTKISRLPLQRLNPDHSHDVIEHVLRRRPIPHEIKRNIVEKSDGVPLFLEEIAKAVVERATERNAGASSPFDVEITVPPTLHDSLAARLDRLPGAKRVAQIGATIGRQFAYEVLAAVCPLAKKEVSRALDDLTAADVLKRSGLIPNAVYTFKHALLRDSAYKSQLKTERTRLHNAIAGVLEERFPDEVAAEPQLLAHHYAEAGDYRRAIPYRLRAASRSAERAAYREALEHLDRAFEYLGKLPNDRDRDKIELELRVAKGLSLERTLGYGAPEIKENYERARELCHELGETVDMVPVLLGLYVFHLVRADLAVAHDLAGQCVKLSNDSLRFDYLIEANAAVGYVLCYLGQLEKARLVLEEGVRQYELNWGTLQFMSTAQDPGVASLALLSVVLWLLGHPEESLDKLGKAFELANRLGQPINRAVALAHAAQLRQLRREPERAAAHAEEGIAVAKQIGNLTWQTACSMHLGIAKALLGDAEAGVALAKQQLEFWRAGGAEVNRPYFLAGIAQGEMAAGRPEQALLLLTEALAHAARSGEAYFVPLVHEVRAECLAALPGRAAEAEQDLHGAIEAARLQGSKMLELRALRSLCRVGSSGTHRQALAALLANIGGGGDTLDVREARTAASV